MPPREQFLQGDGLRSPKQANRRVIKASVRTDRRPRRGPILQRQQLKHWETTVSHRSHNTSDKAKLHIEQICTI